MVAAAAGRAAARVLDSSDTAALRFYVTEILHME
jgi:hypothetical protein